MSVGTFLRPSRRRAMGIASILILSFVGTGLALSALSPRGSSSIDRHGVGGAAPPNVSSLTLQGGAPIPMAKRTTLAMAIRGADFPILRPHDRLASDSTLKAVWAGTGGLGNVALEYRSGILVLVRRSQINDPKAIYQAIQKETGTSYVTSIHGAPALVMLGNIPGRAPSIDMIIGDVDIQVRGGTGPFREDDIIRVASSVFGS
jgi:hypothetical protein